MSRWGGCGGHDPNDKWRIEEKEPISGTTGHPTPWQPHITTPGEVIQESQEGHIRHTRQDDRNIVKRK